MQKARDPRLVQLGAALSAARKANGVSQERLAERVGLSMNHVGAIERGETNPTVLVLVRIAEALGISLASLIAAIEGETSDKRAVIAELDGYLTTRPLDEVTFVVGLARQVGPVLADKHLTLRAGR
ncbi:helix-turn-helix transcriptional regulator [Candidatus Uhrbacteria bacterium]|nr:helix-turn-helix transcriptional regulator [Candidatus Uhrbacteria bacterium]